MVKLLNVLVPEIVCVLLLPLNTTELVLCVKVPAVCVQLLPTLSVEEEAFNVPLVNVTVPVIVCAKEVPRFRVPPTPLIVRAPRDVFPCNVAVPEVFVMDNVPVVVNPAILGAATVPLSKTSNDPKFRLPPPDRKSTRLNSSH